MKTDSIEIKPPRLLYELSYIVLPNDVYPNECLNRNLLRADRTLGEKSIERVCLHFPHRNLDDTVMTARTTDSQTPFRLVSHQSRVGAESVKR